MASTSVPTSGSVMQRPHSHSPLAAFGSTRRFCASLPLTATFCANSTPWASTASAKPGSEVESASSSCTAALASRPAPPYSAGSVTPSRPSAPARRNNARLKRSARSWAAAWGSTSRATNSRSVSASSACSGVGAVRSRERQSVPDMAEILRGQQRLDEALDRAARGRRRGLEYEAGVGHELVRGLGARLDPAGARQLEGDLELRTELERLG